jgi:cytochrome c oxidase subunit 2
MRSRAKKALVLALAGAWLVGAGCSLRDSSKPQNTMDPQGPVARQLDNLIDPVFLIAIVVGVLVFGLLGYIIWKFRMVSDDDAPVQVHGNARMELGWTIAPAVILAGVGIFTVINVLDINRKAVGSDVVNVKVIGHQWFWEYQYPDQKIVTANELHIPIGRPVELEMTSVDVIHSFWPPKLAGKLDVVPGRTNYMKIQSDKPGTFYGQCAEYCGLSHANMRLRVVAHDAAGWDAWVAGQQRAAGTPTDTAATAGSELFVQKGCSGCHTINGLAGAAGVRGPNLTHLQSRSVFAGAIFDLNDRNLRKWLRDPPGQKPMNPTNGQGMPNLHLSEEEIGNLIAYLDTLK